MGASEYEQRIRSLISRKYELGKADARAREVAERHGGTVEEITRIFNALKSETEQVTLKAIEWREEALTGLNKIRAGYDEFQAQVEDVYQNMPREAREKDLQSSKNLEDGLKRSFCDVLN